MTKSAGGWTRVGKWEGGYVRQRRGSRPVYVIERVVAGRRFHVATGASSLGAAMRHLARFEANPSAYDPAGGKADALRLTAELVQGYREHQLGAGVTTEWADEMTRCLGDWAEALGRADLRTIGVHELKDALARWPRRHPQRIKALKGFCKWLRQERGLLRHAEDASLDLRVPQSTPAKWRRRKVAEPERVIQVLRHLPRITADVLLLQGATAWHVSEVRRFAAGGEIVRPTGPGAPLAVLITMHKGGEPTRTPIQHAEHLEVAMRLRGAHIPTRVTTARHMRAACKAAGVEPLQLADMRASVLTWAVELGAHPKQAAEFAQHKSDRTTRRFYLDAAVPSTAVPVLQLQKP